MSDKIEYTITPQQLLSDQGVSFSRKGQWYSCKYCPFCGGGDSKQVYTFGVRVDDFNYNCLRTTCGRAGSFWTLLEHFGLNPKDYVLKRSNSPSHQQPNSSKAKSRFVYRRKD